LPIDTDATMGPVGFNMRAGMEPLSGAKILADDVRRMTGSGQLQ
jgi:hypothetical protein